MAKGKKTSAKKDKSAGYMTANDVAMLASKLIQENEDFHELGEVRMLFLYCRKPITERGGYVPFQVSKLGGKNAYLALPIGADGEWVSPTPQFMLTVHRDAYMLMPPIAQEAMVFSALCRCNVQILESGGKRLKLVKPDIEEFTDVVAKYGQNWMPDGLMAEAVSGQPPLIRDEQKPEEKPAAVPDAPRPRGRQRGAIHDREYQEGRL